MPIGVRSYGFESETEEEVFRGLVTEARATLHPAMHDSPDSVFGGLAAIVATKAAEHGEAMVDTYESFSENAEGVALDRVSAYSGTEREGPTRSTITPLVSVAPGSHAAGTIVAHVDGDETARFESIEGLSNPGSGTALVPLRMRATVDGPVRAPANQLTELVAPPAGVLAIFNPTDADLGSFTEIDPVLRQRRRLELGMAAVSPVAGMRAMLRNPKMNPGVQLVRVDTNRSLTVDAAGRPAKSVEAMVLGGVPENIGAIVWKKLTMGIESFGSHSVQIMDEEGNPQTVWYSRPIARRLFVRIWGQRGSGYPGDEVVRQTLADFSDGTLEIVATNGARITGATDIGGVVYRSRFIAAALTVAGVVSVSGIEFSVDNATWYNLDGHLGPREFVGHLNERGIQSADVTVAMVA